MKSNRRILVFLNMSYGVEIRKVGSPVSLTYRVYRDAVRGLALFYDTVWEELSVITDKKRRFNHAEHLHRLRG